MTAHTTEPNRQGRLESGRDRDQHPSGRIYLCEGPIPAGSYYREWFDDREFIIHETREEVGSPEDTDFIEITHCYKRGITLEKLATDSTGLAMYCMEALLFAVSSAVLSIGVFVNGLDFWLATSDPARLFGVGLLVLIDGFILVHMMYYLRKVYQLRAIGNSIPMAETKTS